MPTPAHRRAAEQAELGVLLGGGSSRGDAGNRRYDGESIDELIQRNEKADAWRRQRTSMTCQRSPEIGRFARGHGVFAAAQATGAKGGITTFLVIDPSSYT
jgi:hypothetical protein